MREIMSTSSNQNIAPYLDYGAVIKAWYRGFGFLNNCRSYREIFFHFSIIPEKHVVELLERSVNSNVTDGSPFFNTDTKKEFPDLDLSSHRLWLWFTVEKKRQGPRAYQIWTSIEKIPDDIFDASIDRLVHTIRERGLGSEPNLFAQFSRDKRISDERLTPILYSTGFRGPLLRGSWRNTEKPN